MRILVVDDAEDMLALMKLLFKGHDVVTASNGIDALNKLDPMPDLILVDNKMPEMSGEEFIRRCPEGPQIIMITGSPDSVDVPCKVLTKPVRFSDLVKIVEAKRDTQGD